MGDSDECVEAHPPISCSNSYIPVPIIAFTQARSLLFGRILQPRVIAEVIGGVLLGPTVMGRIPNFTNTIFPTTSIHLLTLTSTIGIVFYLFIVAIELDVSVAKRNAKPSLAISVTGLVIPLGLGAAIAVPIYHTFVDSSVKFGYFVLFVAVAVGITAFPVLCRILTETRLLDTTVGVLVLSAGIGNDVTGWILLALTVALVNASSGITAFYVLLTGAGYTLFLLLPGRWAFRWLARKTGCLEKGEPTAFMMTNSVILRSPCSHLRILHGRYRHSSHLRSVIDCHSYPSDSQCHLFSPQVVFLPG